jgi:hypothetical protein
MLGCQMTRSQHMSLRVAVHCKPRALEVFMTAGRQLPHEQTHPQLRRPAGAALWCQAMASIFKVQGLV